MLLFNKFLIEFHIAKPNSKSKIPLWIIRDDDMEVLQIFLLGVVQDETTRGISLIIGPLIWMLIWRK